jgi:hypothetical protein
VEAPPVRVVAVVRDSAGRAVRGAQVAFQRRQVTPGELVFLLGPVGAAEPRLPAVDTTDAAGRAEARLWHGYQAAEAWLRVEVRLPGDPQTIAYRDSVAVRTTPGQPGRLLLAPRDTALYQGDSATFVAVVADRLGNVRAERGQLEAGTAGVVVQGTTARATAGPSRQVVRARYGRAVDSAWVSVVPRGTIAVRVLRSSEPDRGYVLATLDLDGSNYRLLLRRGSNAFGQTAMSPQWGHTSDHLLFFDGYPNNQLYAITTDGAVSPLFPARVTEHDTWPMPTRDGAWVYFHGITTGSYEAYIYRARPDGSEVTRVSPGPRASYHTDRFPSPSPDGQHVVYATTREGGWPDDPRLEVVDVATGIIRRLQVAGTAPRWSPTGEWIVFGRNDALFVIHPDGTGLRPVSAPGHRYEPWASWSPDGRWLVAEHHGPYLEVIEVATGLRLPLPFTGFLKMPAWRPD